MTRAPEAACQHLLGAVIEPGLKLSCNNPFLGISLFQLMAIFALARLNVFERPETGAILRKEGPHE